MNCSGRSAYELAPEYNSLAFRDVELKNQIENIILEYSKENGLKPKKGNAGWQKGYYKYPKPYSVYVLRCDNLKNPDCLEQKFEDIYKSGEWNFDPRNYRTSRHSKYVPKWAWAAHYADERYYVGFSGNPYRRIGDHVESIGEGSLFTYAFPPNNIHRIFWYDEEAKARNGEKTAAELLQSNDTFVFQS